MLRIGKGLTLGIKVYLVFLPSLQAGNKSLEGTESQLISYPIASRQ